MSLLLSCNLAKNIQLLCCRFTCLLADFE
uniref:Uncharacterized protein n=1 Tax=Anguilla anguilla TaxID=7936 RepID=A0A0E9QRN9_ANGAN